MSSIDAKIFDFVAKLKKRSLLKSDDKQHSDFKGIRTIANLGEVANFALVRQDEGDGSLVSKFVDVGEGILIGLDEEDFSHLKELLAALLEDGLFANYANLAFLTEKTFDWIISVYRLIKAEKELTAYLKDVVHQDTKEYHFYFRVLPIGILEKFQIGDVELGYFSEKQKQELYQQSLLHQPSQSFEQFTAGYQENFESIHAHVAVKGVPGRAEEIAKRKAEEAVDVLKCFCAKYALSPHLQLFDLDYRLQANEAGSYMRLIEGNLKEPGLLTKRKERQMPLQITSEMTEEFRSLGIEEFSSFIKSEKRSSLGEEVILGMKQLATIASTGNRYEKVIQIISLAESLCVPKETSGKAKGESRVKKLIPQLTSNKEDEQAFTEAFTKAYRIRDRYLHNYIQLPVDLKMLFILRSCLKMGHLNCLSISLIIESWIMASADSVSRS